MFLVDKKEKNNTWLLYWFLKYDLLKIEQKFCLTFTDNNAKLK